MATVTSAGVPHRIIDTSIYTAAKDRMREVADRIDQRDRKVHTGSTGLLLTIEDAQGYLNMELPKRRRARR